MRKKILASLIAFASVGTFSGVAIADDSLLSGAPTPPPLQDKYYDLTLPQSIPPGSSDGLQVLCDEGDVPTGGGFHLRGGGQEGLVQIFRSAPISEEATNQLGWVVQGDNATETAATVNVHVVCRDFPPYHQP